MTDDHGPFRRAMRKVGDDLEAERLARIAYRDDGTPTPDRMLCHPQLAGAILCGPTEPTQADLQAVAEFATFLGSRAKPCSNGCAAPARRYMNAWWCQACAPTVPVPDPALTLQGRLDAAYAEAAARRAQRDGTPPPADANAARDRALAQVESATPEEWKDHARRAIWHLATTRKEFTTDDVWDRLAELQIGTAEPRALGPVMMRAIRAKAIRPVPLHPEHPENPGEKTVPSRRRHSTKITVYERNPR